MMIREGISLRPISRYILLTDIYRSSRLSEEYPQQYASTLDAHNTAVEKAVSECAGEVYKNTGDGYFAFFSQAADCLACAARLQQEFAAYPALSDDDPFLVRIIAHYGELRPAGMEFFGQALNRASRICQVCHPGQVVFSEGVKPTESDLPEGAAASDLGEHHLRDLAEPEHLYQLDHEGFARREFPPLPTLGNRPNNLFIQPNAFIGREQELADLKAMMLDNRRLVTITAPGGYGKSRLAAHLCADLLESFERGVFFVELAPLRDHTGIITALANATGFQFFGKRDPKEQLLDYLREKEMLLCFDNFEHVLEGSSLISEILKEAPKIKIVVTSREPLRITGEQVYTLEPLPVGSTPVPGGELRDTCAEAGATDTRGGVTSDALLLFTDRATLVDTAFELTEQSISGIQAVCERLDGIPLAIELAAAWTGSFTLSELQIELEQQLELTARLSDVPERHRSIRASLDWSWGLLSDEQQRMLMQLSTFRGGFFLEAASVVLGLKGKALRQELAKLGDKSWLFTRQVDGQTRFFIRDAVSQQYAFEKLGETKDRLDEESTARTSGAAVSGRREPGLSTYRRRLPHWRLPGSVYYITWRLHPEQPELTPQARMLVAKAIEHFDQERYVLWAYVVMDDHVHVVVKPDVETTVEALLHSWKSYTANRLQREHGYHGAIWQDEYLDRIIRDEDELRQKVQYILDNPRKRWPEIADYQWVKVWNDRMAGAEARPTEQEAQPTNIQGDSLYEAAVMAHAQYFSELMAREGEKLHSHGQLEALKEIGLELQNIYEALDTLLQRSRQEDASEEIAAILLPIARWLREYLHITSEYRELVERYQVLKRVAEQAGNVERILLWALLGLGRGHWALGDYDAARDDSKRASLIAKGIGDRCCIAIALTNLGTIERSQSNYDAARELFVESHSIMREIGDRNGFAHSLNNLGAVEHNQGNFDAARELYAESLAIRREIGDFHGIAFSLNSLGAVESMKGNYSAARELFAESLATRREIRDRYGIAVSITNLGLVEFSQGNNDTARELLTESLAIKREIGDRDGAATSLSNLGLLECNQGNYDSGRELHAESLAIWREIGDRYGIAASLTNLGLVEFSQGNNDAAHELLTESLVIKREIGDRNGIAASLNNLGLLEYNQGNYDAARELHAESLAITREVGDREGIALSLDSLGAVVYNQGNYDAACELYAESLAIKHDIGDRSGMCETIAVSSRLVVVAGQIHGAAIQVYGVLHHAAQLGLAFSPLQGALLKESVAIIEHPETGLPVSERERLKAQAEAMTLDELAEYAQDALKKLELE